MKILFGVAAKLPNESAAKAGKKLTEAANRAKDYVARAIAAGSAYCIGHGHGPVHHFHDIWPA